MPRRKVPHGKRRNEELTQDELRDLWRSTYRTGEGCATCSQRRACQTPCYVFASEAERREAWERHREQVLAKPHNPGTRPGAWWKYDAPERPLQDEGQEATLYRLGLLTPEETVLLSRVKPWPPRQGTGRDPRLVLSDE